MFYFHPYDPGLELDPVALMRWPGPPARAGRADRDPRAQRCLLAAALAGGTPRAVHDPHRVSASPLRGDADACEQNQPDGRGRGARITRIRELARRPRRQMRGRGFATLAFALLSSRPGGSSSLRPAGHESSASPQIVLNVARSRTRPARHIWPMGGVRPFRVRSIPNHPPRRDFRHVSRALDMVHVKPREGAASRVDPLRGRAAAGETVYEVDDHVRVHAAELERSRAFWHALGSSSGRTGSWRRARCCPAGGSPWSWC